MTKPNGQTLGFFVTTINRLPCPLSRLISENIVLPLNKSCVKVYC